MVTAETTVDALGIAPSAVAGPTSSEIERLYQNVPRELREKPQWVGWQYEQAPGRSKPSKVPYRSDGRGKASPTDPGTWSGFEAAIERYRDGGWDGIGFVLAPGAGLVCVDLDACVDPATGAIEPWAQDVINLLTSYTERSPSGTGVHIFVHGDLPGTGRRSGGIEMYDGGRFMTMTGDRLGSYHGIEERPGELARLHAQAFPSEQPPIASKPADPLTMGDGELLRRAFDAGNGDKVRRLYEGDTSGYPSPSEADLALLSLLAFWTQDRTQLDRLFRISGLMRSKWDRADYRDHTIEHALSNRTATYSPGATRPIVPSHGSMDANAVDALLRRNAELEGRNAFLELENRVLRNPHLRQGARVLIEVAREVCLRRGKGKAEPDGFVRVPYDRIAEMMGVDKGLIKREIRNAHDAELLEKRTERHRVQAEDRQTGEARSEFRNQTSIRWDGDLLGMMEQLAAYVPATSSRRGGRRARCPLHPDAPVVAHTVSRCSACNKILTAVVEVPMDEEP